MESHLKTLLEKVDDIHQEAYKMNKWTMQVSKQQQEKSKYIHQRVSMTMTLVGFGFLDVQKIQYSSVQL
jgi:hypothetical protein